MASRPRRSAAQKAHEAITDWADSERTTSTPSAAPTITMSTRSRRSDGRPSGGASVSRDPPSSPGNDHVNVNIKVTPGRLRDATSGGRGRNGGSIAVGGAEIVSGKRNRGGKKSYVIQSDNSDFDGDDDEEMDEDSDADGDDDMEVDADGDGDDDEDAEGEEDADGDVDMGDTTQASHATVKIQNPKASAAANKPPPRRAAAANRVVDEDDDEDDEEELSEIEVSDPENNTKDMSINVGGGVGEEEDDEEEEDEEDAEGEEEDEEDAEGEEDAGGDADVTLADADAGGDDDLGSDDESGSRAQTPDLSKMTRRQRARFEETPQDYMKLPDEVQAKKVFTAEELSMRRQEMARRRRNLSEKRNEEVKMETINKLLKKQAPKTTRKAAGASAAAAAKDSAGAGGANDTPGEEDEGERPEATLVRWINNKQGSSVSIPQEMVGGPAGKVFGAGSGSMGGGKMVQEVK